MKVSGSFRSGSGSFKDLFLQSNDDEEQEEESETTRLSACRRCVSTAKPQQRQNASQPDRVSDVRQHVC